MLEVVEQEQELPPAEESGQVVGGADRPGDLRGQELGIGETRERHPEDAVAELPDELGRDLKRETRLARAARAREGQEARAVREQGDELFELTLAADERDRDDWQVGRVERPKRRELAVAELVEALCSDQVLQAVLAEVTQRSGRLEQAARRLRDDDLAAVRGGCNPRRSVHVDADVALVGHERLAGVDAHPNADRAGLERPLRLGRRGDGSGRPRERDEERVSLGVDFDPVVPPEGLAEHAPVLGEEIGVGRPVLVEETRRPFDVGEEERDRAGWQRLLRPRCDHLAQTGGKADTQGASANPSPRLVGAT